MQSLEKEQSKQWAATKDTRQDIAFGREAKSGAWRKKLSARDIKIIENAWGGAMKELGYELATNTEPDRELVRN